MAGPVGSTPPGVCPTTFTFHYIPREIMSDAYFHERGIAYAMNYFSNEIRISICSFRRALMQLGHGSW